ncbi:MAG: hypothetical protein QOD75_560 [Blastocatellia bacterium]|jgi:uncharacterized protein YjbI with pentapeptide repeats|nr:hypothetical protein [Blastocatellia bacterium]
MPVPHSEFDFVCDCQSPSRSACKWLRHYEEHQGKNYCVLHFPGMKKSAVFAEAVQRKLMRQDFDFRGAWFPAETAFFKSAIFSGRADFREAIFTSKADFTSALFQSDADFTSAIFRADADFSNATFRGQVDFISTYFQAGAVFKDDTFDMNADFSNATFDDYVDFSEAIFKGNAGFRQATFIGNTNFERSVLKGYVEFAGTKRFAVEDKRPGFNDKASLSLESAKIDNPDQISFHTLTMRPSWFVNVDCSRFDLTNVEWGRYKLRDLRFKQVESHPWRTIEEELSSLSLNRLSVADRHRMFAITCSRLADNAEENRRFEEASRFRHMAMDTRRRLEWPGLTVWKLSWWYWLASGYGERALQALGILAAVWVLFALLYTQGWMKWEPKPANSTIVHPAEVFGWEKFKTELTYSAAVITLQRPEPKPASRAAQAAVLAETILGPLQAAMLALAIRRKFMR